MEQLNQEIYSMYADLTQEYETRKVHCFLHDRKEILYAFLQF